MGEKAKSLVESMKERISRSGSKKSQIFYLKKDGKCRVRFLQDMNDGVMVQFHDKFGEFNHVCLKYFGEDCPNCKNKEARTTDQFVWSVWNYETKRVELFVFKANKASPIPALVSMFENYGTICDRDYVIQRNGSGFETNYSVIPMDKKKFKGEEEAYTKKKMLKILMDAFPVDDEDIETDDEDDEDEDEAPKKTKKSKKVIDDDDDEDIDEDEDDEEEKPKKKSKKADKKKAKKKVVEDDEDEDDFDEDDDEDEELKKKSKKSDKKKSKKKIEDDDDDEDDVPPWEDDDDDEEEDEDDD